MNTSLHHIVAQLRIEEMRHQAERARCARDPETAHTWGASRHTRARTWAARHWHRPGATGVGTSSRPGEMPR
jgi:hypothetical protein